MITVIKKSFNLFLLSAFLFAFLIRLYKISFHEFWYDEVMAILISRHPLKNWTPPFYYIFFHYWNKFFPSNFFWARIPSLIFNFLTIIIFYMLAKKFWNKRIAIIGSLIAILSPFQIWYSQEARLYTMSGFFTVISFYFFLKLLKNETKLNWIFFLIFSLIGIYTSYFCFIVLIIELLYFIKLKKLKWFYPILIFAGFSFWLFPFLRKFLYIKYGFWLPVPNILSLRYSFENFILGYNGNNFLYFAVDFIILYLLIVYLIRRKSRQKDLYTSSLFWIFTIGMGGVFLFSKFILPIYLDRGLIIFSWFLYLILAITMERRVFIFGLLFVFLLIGDFNYFHDKTCPAKHRVGVWLKKPVLPALNYLKEKGSPYDLYLATHTHLLPISYFYSFPYKVYFCFEKGLKDEAWRRKLHQGWLYRDVEDINKLINPKTRYIWVMDFLNIWGMEGKITKNGEAIIKYLKTKFNFKEVKDIGAIRIYEFSTGS
jgi:hypothetical protein